MIRNDTAHWGAPAKLLHWVGALAILVLLLHGWWMTHLAPRPDRMAHYTWHSALGYDLLALTILRVLWRWMNPTPTLPPDLKRWERMSAHAGHLGLYVLMFATTLSGWALAGTFRTPILADLFGLKVPAIASPGNRAVHEFFEETHEITAYLLAALVALHVIGAMRHHLGKKNDVMRRMAFGLRRT